MEIINFAKETISRYFPSNRKFTTWGDDNLLPNRLQEFYDSIPEHSSCIDFIVNSLTNNEIFDNTFILKKKLYTDYYMYGGFAVEITKNRDNTLNRYYISISNLRYSQKGDEIGYSENWHENNTKITWRSISDGTTPGIFVYKNTDGIKYPRPTYTSTILNLDTYQAIMEYHNNNAKSGFTPTVVFNLNDGIPDKETQLEYEKKIKDKFTGTKGQKFILMFNNNKDSAPTIQTIQADNLDEKFETLQKFIQNLIFVAHKITSPTLLGIKAENQGFSKTEFTESLEVFEEKVIKPLQREIEFGFNLIKL
jgi:hypothetical protein